MIIRQVCASAATTCSTEPFNDLGVTNNLGWVLTDDRMATDQPGIFAIGDVREKELRQITTAVGDAAIAGQAAYGYVEALKDVASAVTE